MIWQDSAASSNFDRGQPASFFPVVNGLQADVVPFGELLHGPGRLRDWRKLTQVHFLVLAYYC